MSRSFQSARTLLVGVTVPRNVVVCQQMLVGAAGYGLEHGLRVLDLPINEGHWPDAAAVGCDGLIAFASEPQRAAALRAAAYPVVNVSATLEDPGLPTVSVENRAVGRLAAEHLLEQGHRRLAFVGLGDHFYSLERMAGFAEAAEAAGIEAVLMPTAEFTLDEPVARTPLGAWLLGLAKPVGVMACNDIRGRHVIEACRLLGLAVPDEVAVVGVDNDEPTCLSLQPPLSSVECNARAIGHRAAELVHGMLQGRVAPQRTLLPPVGVVPRASTGQVVADDEAVRRSLGWIRANASRAAVGVPDVAEAVGVSRRTLERRFKAATGSGVAAALRAARVQRARQLLLDTDLPLDAVARAAGLGGERQLRMVFAKVLARPPSSFR